MYHPVENGSVLEIQNVQCQLPPVGYGIDRLTGKLEYIGVVGKSEKKKNQKWKRLPLPDDYEKIFEEEQGEQINRLILDPTDDWTDERLDKIRDIHWRYRLCGYWFMNDGIETYLTGTYWFYLNWFASNTVSGYMEYRSPDRELFYIISHTDASPVAGGVVFVGRRQCGKTYMANAWMLDRISLYKKKHGGIQSKTGDDAEKVFIKLVNAFVDLPEFFIPTYDKSQGLRPKKTLRFFKTNVKGKNADDIKKGVELRSYIDFASNKSEDYDGDESMFCYILDEFGKKQLSDVQVTWETVRACMDKEGKWFGKAFICSTIEDIEDVGEGPRSLFFGSDIKKLNQNNRTETGLYSVFFGSQYTTYFDDYGNSLVDKATQFHLNEIAAKTTLRSLASYKRKNPFVIGDAFRVDGDKCLYESELLNNQLDILHLNKNSTEKGNFVWKDGARDTTVVWEKCANGKWEICWMFDKPGESNKISKIGNYFKPENTKNFVAGGDTFSHSIVKDNRRSDGALLVKMKYDPTSDNPYNNAFVCKYKHRAPSTEIQYEDMLKTAVFYGCQILFESNKNGWRDYFIARGYEAFLMKLKDYPDYGMPSTPKNLQKLAEETEAYILEYSKKVWFKDCLTDWLEFDINNTTAYDTAMAAGYTLIADNKLLYMRTEQTIRPITDYFKRRKIRA